VLADKRRVVLALCWAHFYELAAAGPKPIVNKEFRRSAELYQRKSSGNDRPSSAALRARMSRPVVDDIEPWLREKLPDQPDDETRRSDPPLYTLTLRRSKPVPRRRPHRDRQQCRRALDPSIALAKNALFAGSDGGAEHWGRSLC
jgi:transposase